MNKFIIFGYGHIGKRHASIIQKDKDLELFAVIEPKPQNWVETIEGKPVRFFLSFESLLENTKEQQIDSYIDFIGVIASPNSLHSKHAIQCIESGMHVLIEKPITIGKKDAELLINLANSYQRKVFCIMQNRYSPPSIWLKSLLAEEGEEKGVLGEIYHVQVNCIWNRSKEYYSHSDWKGKKNLDGGTLYTQFSHFIDSLIWLFGEIQVKQANFYNFNHPYIEFEDSGKFDFEIKSGGIGTFFYSTSAIETNLESSITILAEKGSVKVGGQYMDKVISCQIQNYSLPDLAPTKEPNDYGSYKGSAANHENVYENLKAVFAGTAEIATTAQEGMKVVELIEEVYRFKM